MKNFHKVLSKASNLKRCWSEFMGLSASSMSSGVEDSANSTMASLDSLQIKFERLEDRVSDLDADTYAKLEEARAQGYVNADELTRGMAYLRGFVLRESADCFKKTSSKLDIAIAKNKASDEALKELTSRFDNEIAKNEIKDKAFKELLERVESLEAKRFVESQA
jgi:hypothetical protein